MTERYLTKSRLMTPGPTPTLAGAVHSHHRSDAFREIFADIQTGLQYFFDTRHPVLTLAATGSGGLESVVANFVGTGTQVLAINAGKFGERWGATARAFGADVLEITPQAGQSVEPTSVADAFIKNPDIEIVLMQGCETSTGAVMPVREIAELVRETDALLCVDGISWLGAHKAPCDDWGIDVVVCAGQKAMAMSPGLSFVSLSDRAIGRIHNDGPKYYFDYRPALKALRDNQTVFTAPVSLIAEAHASLAWVRSVGRETLVANAALLAAMTRDAMQALGLKLFASVPANSVTSVIPPDGISATTLVARLEERFGITMAEGQNDLRGEILRFAHLGNYDYLDTIGVIGALENALVDCGANVPLGAGVAAAQATFRRITGSE